MSYMSKGHVPDCEVPYNGGDCDCAWHWEEMAQVNKNETTAEKKARLQRELAEINAQETKEHEDNLKVRMFQAVAGLSRESQQQLRNMLTKHIQDTYDGDDE